MKRFDETCKIIGEQYRESLVQEVIVHELIHAISKTQGLGIGLTYFDEQNVKHNVSINEGITERLAMDVCELPDVFLTVKKDDFQVAGNTVSSYKLETGIANLLRVIDGEKFYLKYLVLYLYCFSELMHLLDKPIHIDHSQHKMNSAYLSQMQYQP